MHIITILALGDSLTAGYGLEPGKSFPDQLGALLAAEGLKVRIVNAGVSGDTTAGGLARLEWNLTENPDAAIVELGANDALRGIDPARTRENLEAILTRLAERGVPTLLAGMRAPFNMGGEYAARFNAIFPALADKYEVLFYPFFLQGVAGEQGLNQSDGLHPNEEGTARIAENLLPMVRELILLAR